MDIDFTMYSNFIEWMVVSVRLTISDKVLRDTISSTTRACPDWLLCDSQEHGQAAFNLHQRVCIDASEGLPYLVALYRNDLVYHHL